MASLISKFEETSVLRKRTPSFGVDKVFRFAEVILVLMFIFLAATSAEKVSLKNRATNFVIMYFSEQTKIEINCFTVFYSVFGPK